MCFFLHQKQKNRSRRSDYPGQYKIIFNRFKAKPAKLIHDCPCLKCEYNNCRNRVNFSIEFGQSRLPMRHHNMEPYTPKCISCSNAWKLCKWRPIARNNCPRRPSNKNSSHCYYYRDHYKFKQNFNKARLLLGNLAMFVDFPFAKIREISHKNCESQKTCYCSNIHIYLFTHVIVKQGLNSSCNTGSPAHYYYSINCRYEKSFVSHKKWFSKIGFFFRKACKKYKS